MQYLDTDWFEFATRAAVWNTLTRETRTVLIEQAPSDAIRLDAFGADAERLVAESFVAVAGTGRASLHPFFRPFARALRGMRRHDVLGVPTAWTASEYLRDQFTHAERHQLAGRSAYYHDVEAVLLRGVTSEEWVRDALRVAARGETVPRKQSGPQKRILETELGRRQHRSQVDAARIVVAVLEQGGYVPLEQLPDLVALHVPADRFSTAVQEALARVWLLATVRRTDLVPVLTLWPGITERLLRQPPVAPAPVDAVEVFDAAFLGDDATAVLVAAASEPLRLRGNDFALYARATKRIAAALVPVPAWVADEGDVDADSRINAAIQFLSGLELLEIAGVAGEDLRLDPTKEARAWLALPAADRLRSLHDLIRPVSAADDDGGGGRRPRLFTTVIQPGAVRKRVEHAAASALGNLPDGDVVPLDAFTEYYARVANPLDNERTGRDAGYVDHIPIDLMTGEQREQVWGDMLEAMIVDRLVPLGGAILARIADDDIGVAVTPLGRYLLGLTDAFDAGSLAAPAGGAAPRIVVQPNFDVVFLAPSPAAEAEIGRFAERTGAGIGTLFRITREAVYNAAGAGLDAGTALGTLHSFSSQPLPANVEREVSGWFGACRRVRARQAWLLHCPDSDTATRALAAAGRGAVRIAPTTLEIMEPRQRNAIMKKLRKHGIFVDE